MNQAGETDHRPETLGEIVQMFDDEKSELERQLDVLKKGQTNFISALTHQGLEGDNTVLFEVAHKLGTSQLQGDRLTPVLEEKPDLASLRIDEVFPNVSIEDKLRFLIPTTVSPQLVSVTPEERPAVVKSEIQHRGRKKASTSTKQRFDDDPPSIYESFLKFPSVHTLRNSDNLWMHADDIRFLKIETLQALFCDRNTGSALPLQKFKWFITNQLNRLQREGITTQRQPDGEKKGKFLDEQTVFSLLSNIYTGRSTVRIREQVPLEEFENVKTNLPRRRGRRKPPTTSNR